MNRECREYEEAMGSKAEGSDGHRYILAQLVMAPFDSLLLRLVRRLIRSGTMEG
jgi:hypothetical protein